MRTRNQQRYRLYRIGNQLLLTVTRFMMDDLRHQQDDHGWLPGAYLKVSQTSTELRIRLSPQPTQTKLKQFGNSLAFVVPGLSLDLLGWHEGDEMMGRYDQAGGFVFFLAGQDRARPPQRMVVLHREDLLRLLPDPPTWQPARVNLLAEDGTAWQPLPPRITLCLVGPQPPVPQDSGVYMPAVTAPYIPQVLDSLDPRPEVTPTIQGQAALPTGDLLLEWVHQEGSMGWLEMLREVDLGKALQLESLLGDQDALLKALIQARGPSAWTREDLARARATVRSMWDNHDQREGLTLDGLLPWELVGR